MEKEVRAMLDKGEKVTLIHIQKTDEFCIKDKEYEIVDHGTTMVWIIDEEGTHHSFTYKNLKEYFKLKQPKDPNELIGRKVKGFRFDNKPKLSCAYTNEMDNYIDLIGEIKKHEVDSYKVRFEDNYFWYPADQIEAHLLPEKKTKKERIEELEKRVEQLERKLFNFSFYHAIDFTQELDQTVIELHEVSKFKTQNLEDAKSMTNDKNDLWKFFRDEHNLTLLDSEIEDIIHEVNKYQQQQQKQKQAPEFWYVDIVEEKDSELLPKFKEWFLEKSNASIDFLYSKYGFSGWEKFNGYDWISINNFEANSDKMQKITLKEWNTWFNK